MSYQHLSTMANHNRKRISDAQNVFDIYTELHEILHNPDKNRHCPHWLNSDRLNSLAKALDSMMMDAYSYAGDLSDRAQQFSNQEQAQ